MEYMEEDGSQGRFPYSFPETFEFFKDCLIGLEKVERLSQQLNVPQTGKRPFSLTTAGSDPQPGIELGLHW